MAVAICVTSARCRSAVKGMGGVIADCGGSPRSSCNCCMSTSELRAYACYREASAITPSSPWKMGVATALF